MVKTSNNLRLIAFYLPQFHPIPENDEWWGKGFTEWTNVAKAKPLFRGHYQPHIPADLGFYDLRLPETRIAQAELAKKYGIEGFCYWHYWFNGKRVLDRPFSEVLSSGQPDFPFCLAWANESWTRTWLGQERHILLEQSYSEEDDLSHIRCLLKAFSDPRYIRIRDRPLFLIYRPRSLPDANKTTDVFRTECLRNGISEPYLLGIDAHCSNTDCRQLGFDGTVNFEPQLSVLPQFLDDRAKVAKLVRNFEFRVIHPKLKIYDYSAARRRMMSRMRDFPVYPCIFVGWDNTPRRGRNAIVITNSTPENFEAGLVDIFRSVVKEPDEYRLLFINAWNEWAEGNHLEPDLKHGPGFLEAIARALSASLPAFS
jgi:lipopolysaccharide biosynthesis protein